MAAPATTTTTTTTTTEEDNGHSTGSLVATGLLAFGAGMLVNEVFDDDDDYYNNGYYGNMYHGGMPYYPPYPYRPAYGGGYYPGNSYNRPNNYVRGGNTVIVNQNNNYYNRYNSPNGARNSPQSPITKAKPGRNDLNQLNAKAKQGPARRAPSTSEALQWQGWIRGQQPAGQEVDGQAGDQGRSHRASRTLPVRTCRAATPAPSRVRRRPASHRLQERKAAAPKVQGSYAGAKPAPKPSNAAARPASQQANRPRLRSRRIAQRRSWPTPRMPVHGRASRSTDTQRPRRNAQRSRPRVRRRNPTGRRCPAAAAAMPITQPVRAARRACLRAAHPRRAPSTQKRR